MKQTSIDWLEMEIVKLEQKYAIPHEIYVLCEQAKEIDRINLIDAYETGDKYKFEIPGEQYYNETFKKQK